MRAGEFARRRALIENAKRGRSFRRKAMRALARRAGAAIILPNGRHVGYRLPDGSVACAKHRYRDEVAAQMELARIRRDAVRGYVPVRAYRCEWCDGWHLTSRPASGGANA